MDVLGIDVGLLVLAHYFIHLEAKTATVFLEVAAQFHQVEDGDHFTATDSNELEHEITHISLAILSRLTLPPLSACIVFILGQYFFLWPEHHQTREEHSEIDLVSSLCVV